jgi:hypothetical protein
MIKIRKLILPGHKSRRNGRFFVKTGGIPQAAVGKVFCI